MKYFYSFFIIFIISLLIYGCGSVSGGSGDSSDDTVLYPAYSFLKVSGKKIVNANGTEVNLKGVGVANNIYSSNTPTTNISWDHDEADFTRIKGWGANVIRFYMDSDWFDATTSADAWAYVTQNIEWAENNELYLILDMHFAPGETLTDKSGLWNSTNKNNLITLWGDIATRLKDEVAVAGYDILNEPSPNVVADWYTLAQDITDEIRSRSDQHIVIVEEPLTKRWIDDNFATFTKLTDNNVLYSFHFYEPFEFTHQGASWVGSPPEKIHHPFTDFTSVTYQSGEYGFPAATSAMIAWRELDGGVFSTPNASWDIGIIEFGGAANTAVMNLDDIRLVKRYLNGTTENISVFNGNMEVADSGWYASRHSSATLTYSFLSSGGIGNSGCLQITQINPNGQYANLSQREGLNWYYPTYYFNADSNCGYKVVGNVKVDSGDPNGSNFRISWNTVTGKKVWNASQIATSINVVAAQSTAQNVPFYCGEFGAVAVAPTDNEALWTDDVKNALDAAGIHWTYHVYRDYLNDGSRRDMGIYSTTPNMAIDDNTENTDVINALF